MIDDESHVNFENKLITSGTRVFLWCSFFDRKGMRKKEKIRKKKGKRLSPSAAFSDQILIPWQTIECTRLNNSRSLEFTREERGRNVGSFSWTAAARSSPKKSDGYFFFLSFFKKVVFTLTSVCIFFALLSILFRRI